LTRWLKEPLLHFTLLGVGLFALYRLVSGGESSDPDEIVVEAPRIAALAESFHRSWRRPPTPKELDGLVESYVRDEVLYREGLALGLDREDAVIRSRVRVKMELLSDGPEEPVTDADLQSWFDANAERYATPTRYEVRQVFFDPAGRRTQRADALGATLRELEREPELDPATLGDPTLLPAVLSDVARVDVAAQFGEELAGALVDAPTGRWFGPVRSPYGEHLLRVDLLHAPEAAVFAHVRDDVERDVRYARAQIARDALYERLRTRYIVRIENPAGDLDTALAAEPR
jgi:PPIC-type PPIASE domain